MRRSGPRAASPAAGRRPALEAPGGAAEQATLLVVDDSPAMRRLLWTVLSAAGFRVLKAENGLAGLALLRAHAVDLMITDINMPHMNGYELIAQARRICPVLPILILTSETDEDRQRRGLSAGASAWILKPFSPAVLIERVGALLGRG